MEGTINLSEEELAKRTCLVCLKVGCKSFCGKCGNATYCGQEHKRENAEDHRKICNNLRQLLINKDFDKLDQKSNGIPLIIGNIEKKITTGDGIRNLSQLVTEMEQMLKSSNVPNINLNTERRTDKYTNNDMPKMEEMMKRRENRLMILDSLKQRARLVIPKLYNGSREAIREAYSIKTELMKITIENDMDVLLVEDEDVRIGVCRDNLIYHLEIVITQPNVSEAPAIGKFARQIMYSQYKK